MSARQPFAYWLMIGLSLLSSILAVLTLLPSPGASKPNVFGYRSVCSFAPAATALCGLLAGISCTLRNRLVSARRAATRYTPLFLPAGVGLALLAVAAVSGAAFVRAQSRFIVVIEKSEAAGRPFGSLVDGTRRAAVSEGEVSATVELTVVSGRVLSLSLREARNVESSVAEAIFAAVRTAQSTEVEAVSGATASSKVLLKAIGEAARGAR